MENIKEIYSDGIGKIHFIGGMLRLDLFSFNPDQEDAAGKPKPEVVQRVVMSPNAFLASYDSFLNMIDKLKAANILADRTEETATEETTVDDTPADTESEEKK